MTLDLHGTNRGYGQKASSIIYAPDTTRVVGSTVEGDQTLPALASSESWADRVRAGQELTRYAGQDELTAYCASCC
jgi:hypothetical protein